MKIRHQFIKNFKPETEDDKLLIEGLELLISEEYEEFVKSTNPDIRRVAEQIMSLNKDERARLAMEMQAVRELEDRLEREAELKEERAKGRAEGREEGRAKGLAEGKKETLEENIKTMYKNGATIETIAKLLDMNIEQVREIVSI